MFSAERAAVSAGRTVLFHFPWGLSGSHIWASGTGWLWDGHAARVSDSSFSAFKQLGIAAVASWGGGAIEQNFHVWVEVATEGCWGWGCRGQNVRTHLHCCLWLLVGLECWVTRQCHVQTACLRHSLNTWKWNWPLVRQELRWKQSWKGGRWLTLFDFESR